MSNRFSLVAYKARATCRIIRITSLVVVIVLGISIGARPLYPQGNEELSTIDGKVCASSGQPISGALITLLIEPREKEIATKTDVDGLFVLKVVEGTYSLRATKQGWRPAVVDAIRLGAAEKKHVDIVLESLDVRDRVSGNKGIAEGEGAELQFSDEPNFTVAGVTDWSSAGLHGSGANVGTSEALAKETAALRPAGGRTLADAKGADAHRLLGDAKEKGGDPVGAVNEYEKAARMDPSEENYFAWGTELLLHRASGAAIEVFSKARGRYTDSGRILAGLGAAYYANGQVIEAARRVCEASDLRPLDTEPYLLLGKMEKAAAEPLPCSEEKLARFAEQQPENAQANYYYGLVLWKAGRKSQSRETVEQAEGRFKKATQIDPGFAEAYVQLGMASAARGDLQGALLAYQKAVEANPKLAVAHYQLSLGYRRTGEIAKADRELEMYREMQRAELARQESERREWRQFVTILKAGPTVSTPR